MEHVRYLIVGGGMTGHAAAAAIRGRDPDGRLVVLGAEPGGPYARPPLSKGLWLGKEESSIALPVPERVDWVAGRRAVALDPATHALSDDRGNAYRYDRLLLATGARPRRLPFGGDAVIYYRTREDYQRLRDAGRRVVVIGGGFIGSELAAALTQAGREVTMIFPEERIGARVYPRALCDFLARTFAEKGIRVLAGEQVAGIEADGAAAVVRTGRGEALAADAVVAGIGVVPDTALAEAAGIRCSDGIEVDARLRASVPDVYAAGDVARFPSRALGRSMRVEHEDAALTMGALAGANMAGADEAYDHLPFFYSDLFDLGYEAVGVLDARLETVESWKTPFREGAVYYLDGDSVRGVLLWGMFGHVDAARALIEGRRPVRRADLAAAIG